MASGTPPGSVNNPWLRPWGGINRLAGYVGRVKHLLRFALIVSLVVIKAVDSMRVLSFEERFSKACLDALSTALLLLNRLILDVPIPYQ